MAAPVASLVVCLTPNARQSAVVGWQDDGSLKLRLAAKPVDGEANAALAAFLARQLGLPKRDICLTHGHTGRLKRLSVAGLTEADLRARLNALLPAPA